GGQADGIAGARVDRHYLDAGRAQPGGQEREVGTLGVEGADQGDRGHAQLTSGTGAADRAPPWLTAFLPRSRRSSDRSTGSPFPRLIPGQRDARDVASLVRARENQRYGRVSRRDFLLAPLPAPDDADDRAVDEIRAPGRSRPSRCSELAREKSRDQIVRRGYPSSRRSGDSSSYPPDGASRE